MGDFLRLFLDSIAYLWPFDYCQPYERGNYLFCGKRLFRCRPGIPYPKIPWFCEVQKVSVVRRTLVTPLQTITCQDGDTLTYSASVQVEIDDPNLAYNAVDQWTETTTEDVAAALSEKLADVPTERLSPENRGRLIGALRQSLASQVGQYGVRILSLRFNNFVRNIPVFRLFNDQIYGGQV